MDSDDWKLEMNRMLDSFANQAELSLVKISRRFDTLGRPFDEEFRQYYLKMSHQRLDMSYDAVLFARATARYNEIDKFSNIPNRAEVLVPDASSLKNENTNHGDLIEIYDSDDGEDARMRTTTGVVPVDHTETDARNESLIESTTNNENSNDTHMNDVVDLGSEDEVKPPVKKESNAENGAEPFDLELVTFDPNKLNGDAIEINKGSGSRKTHQTVSSSSAECNQSKQNEDKRFKCKHCPFKFESKCKFKRHLPIHANGKLIGVKADSNGMYHCNLCVRQFLNVNHLSTHMKSHKNGQRLYYCVRCMRQFDRETKKEQHESQCEGRHFECHLCKVYVTRLKSHMQNHMRTHSGAKSFQCMVCNKFFQGKANLKSHLNAVHSRNK